MRRFIGFLLVFGLIMTVAGGFTFVFGGAFEANLTVLLACLMAMLIAEQSGN